MVQSEGNPRAGSLAAHLLRRPASSPAPTRHGPPSSVSQLDRPRQPHGLKRGPREMRPRSAPPPDLLRMPQPRAPAPGALPSRFARSTHRGSVCMARGYESGVAPPGGRAVEEAGCGEGRAGRGVGTESGARPGGRSAGAPRAPALCHPGNRAASNRPGVDPHVPQPPGSRTVPRHFRAFNCAPSPPKSPTQNARYDNCFTRCSEHPRSGEGPSLPR